MAIVIIILFIVIAVAISCMTTKSHKNQIENRIISMGATLIEYERCSFFTGLGPFKIVGKGSVVYKVLYEINDERKECWVRFSGLLGADWRM